MGGTKFAILATSLVLANCSTMRAYVAEIDESSVQKFCEAQRGNPEVAGLSGKVPIVSPDEITPVMLALESVPTLQEAEAIKLLARDQHECREKMDRVAKDHWPTQNAMRKALAFKLDLVTAQLIKRRITFGNANRLYQEAALEAEGALTADRKEQLDKVRAQEAIAWRTVGDGIRAIAGSQKPESDPEPCNWSGATMDCGGP